MRVFHITPGDRVTHSWLPYTCPASMPRTGTVVCAIGAGFMVRDWLGRTMFVPRDQIRRVVHPAKPVATALR